MCRKAVVTASRTERYTDKQYTTMTAAENVYTLKLVTMMQAVAGEYQQEITFDQANTTYTFVDFLGSGCNFTIKIEPQEGVSLDDISKYKYIKPGEIGRASCRERV